MSRKILRDFTGVVFLRTQIGLFRFCGVKKKAAGHVCMIFYRTIVVFYAVFIAAFALAGRLDLFLMMWMVPMMTTHQFFLRIRNIAEHATVPDLDDP